MPRRSTIERLRRHWALVPEVLRWRGPIRFSLIVARELARPLVCVRVVHVFETTLDPPICLPPPPEGVAVHVADPDDALLPADLGATGAIAPDVAGARLNRGDAVVVARAGQQVVGFAWLGFASSWDPHLGATMIVGAGEARHYDSFVMPAWRGKQVHAQLLAVAKRHARDRGCRRTVSWIAALNTPSLKVSSRFGQQRTTLVFFRLANSRLWILSRTSLGAQRFSKHR